MQAGQRKTEGQKETERTVTVTERQQGLTSRLQGQNAACAEHTHTSVLHIEHWCASGHKDSALFLQPLLIYMHRVQFVFPGTNLSLT